MLSFKRYMLLLLILLICCLQILASSWETFLLAHTLDPNDPETANYQTWDADSWNRWLADREFLHQRENKYRGQPLTQKGVNSVIVATPEEILSTFAHPKFFNNGMTWSNQRFQTYVFQSPYHRVLDCGPLFFSARLQNGRPVHLQKSSDTPVQFGNANFSFRNCRRIR